MAVITVEELFKLLSDGELNNLAIAVEGGAIKKAQQNRVITFANEALLRLHSRFPLIEEITTIELTTGESKTVAMDDDDVIQITSLITPYGESLSIGRKKIPDTLYVADGNLFIPSSVSDLVSSLQATLQKRHPTLRPVHGSNADDGDSDTPDGLEQEIDLVPELHEALTAYIAQKFYSTMNTAEGAAIAANHRTRYEQVIGEAMNQGVLPGDLFQLSKLDSRGFV
jgi:hypothetical protein